MGDKAEVNNEVFGRYSRRRRLIRGFLPLASLLLFALVLIGPGQKDAVSQTAPRMDYVAFGDSVSRGYYSTNRATDGYVPRYDTYAETDTGAQIKLNHQGKNASTSSELLATLRKNKKVRQSVRGAEVITWNIGQVDFFRAMSLYSSGICGGADNQNCLRRTTATFKANWDGIVREITTLRPPGKAAIRTMDLYEARVNSAKTTDSWPDDGPLGSVNDFEVYEVYLNEANDRIHESSTRNGIPVAEVHQAFNGPDGNEDPWDKGYISFDEFHPNDRGHEVIAEELRKLGYEPFG